MAAKDQIITTLAVHTSPTIAQQEGDQVPTFTIKQRREDVDRYWKIVDEVESRRKIFPVEYWQLEKMFAEGKKNVAFHVKDIHDPNIVTAAWIAFDPEKKRRIKKNEYYFVLSEEYYKGSIGEIQFLELTHTIEGLSNVKLHSESTNFLVALLGKDEQDKYTVYIHNATAELIETDPPGPLGPTPGGEGAGGVKLPP